MHFARISWAAEGDVTAGCYGRAHDWTFDGGARLRASASPAIVPEPWSDPAAIDPEEAFVAALASCHMLWFLDLARRAGHVPSTYDDAAEGVLATRPDGTRWIARVTLRPTITWAAAVPDRAALTALHGDAHHHCFIANSVRTDVVTEIPQEGP